MLKSLIDCCVKSLLRHPPNTSKPSSRKKFNGFSLKPLDFSLQLGRLAVGERSWHTNQSRTLTLTSTGATWSAQPCYQSSPQSCFKRRSITKKYFWARLPAKWTKKPHAKITWIGLYTHGQTNAQIQTLALDEGLCFGDDWTWVSNLETVIWFIH